MKHSILNVLLGDDTSDLQENPQLAPFVRAGILDACGEFSCIASRWYYNMRRFPNRATETPSSLDDLVIRAVQSISATRLRATLQDGFPKEATFQHLFNEALSLHLPIKDYIIPELNTFTTSTVDGTDHQFGELDFYINGDLQWCLELLRLGDKIGEHVAGFDEFEGKYRDVPSSDALVVDCRGLKLGRGAKTMDSRCTLCFSPDFKTCICKMRKQPEIQVDLAN